MNKMTKENIKLDPQEYWLWLATDDGWQRVMGFKATVCNVECSVTMLPTSPVLLIVSSLQSGARILSAPLSNLSVYLCDTKEKTLFMIEKHLENVVKIIGKNGIEYVNQNIEASRLKFEKEFGEMPEIEEAEMEVN